MRSIITSTVILIVPFLGAAQTPSPVPPTSSPNSTCAPVHIIVSRASGEAPGEGMIGSLSTLVKQMIPGATSEALVYPASMPYSGSIPIGVTNLKSMIANYTAACPASRLVLMGYSQGAAVTVDTLCGGGGTYVPPDSAPVTPGMTAVEGQNVVAAVMMGDPRFVPGVIYEAGTNKDNGGVAERNTTAAQCPTFATRMISYCDMGDTRCASGNDPQVHGTYLNRYTNTSAAFIMQKVMAVPIPVPAAVIFPAAAASSVLTP